MTFTGESWLIGIAYAVPLVYLGIRIGQTQKAWLKNEDKVLEKHDVASKLDSQSEAFSNVVKEISDLDAANKKRVNKMLRMAFYFLIFLIIFFWRPLTNA